MKVVILSLLIVSLGASSIHAHELLRGVGTYELVNVDKQCPRSTCRGRECTTNNTLEIMCTSNNGEATSSISPTDISSRQEFKNAKVCDGACARGQRCNARWNGSWRCGGEGEKMTFELIGENDGLQISEDFERD